MDPYQELGLGRDATPADIHAAHRAAVKRHHPDRGGDAGRFDRLQRAFGLLRDPERRRAYDTTGVWEEAPAGFEQRVAAAARAAMMSVVLGAEDLTRIDLVSAALNFLDTQIEGLKAGRAQAERNLERIDIARARMCNLSPEPDALAGVFEAQVKELQAALPALDHQIRIQEAAGEILKRYGYTFEMNGRPVSVSREGANLNLTIG